MGTEPEAGTGQAPQTGYGQGMAGLLRHLGYSGKKYNTDWGNEETKCQASSVAHVFCPLGGSPHPLGLVI